MWRFRVHGWNVADLRSCPWCCPPSVAPRMRGAEFRHCRKLPYVPQPCPAHPGRNLHFSSTNPGVSNSAPRIRAATAAVTFLWCTDAGDGCCRNPPPWCEMLKCCREGVPCFSAVSLRLCRHPVRRWSVLQWSPVRGGRLLEGFSWVVRPVLVCVSLRNWGRVWRGFRLLLRLGKRWGGDCFLWWFLSCVFADW